MLYLLIICIVVCAVVCTNKRYDLNHCPINNKELAIKSRHHLYLAIPLLIFFIISAVVGTVFTSCSDFLSVTTEESSDTYQVTDFSAEKSKNNLLFDDDYETNYSFIIENNFIVEISSEDSDTEIICDTYNPTTVTVEEHHYYKWWFLSTVDTYKYTFS